MVHGSVGLEVGLATDNAAKKRLAAPMDFDL
jgi:hypothetical protein